MGSALSAARAAANQNTVDAIPHLAPAAIEQVSGNEMRLLLLDIVPSIWLSVHRPELVSAKRVRPWHRHVNSRIMAPHLN